MIKHDYGLTFSPNVLDSFYSYTYHFQWKLFDGSAAQTSLIPDDSVNHVIIAESGRTSQFFIDRVEIETSSGTETEARSILPNKITMTLIEPLGFSLVDRILQAARDLNVTNITGIACAPYVLSVKFIGLDEHGIVVSDNIASNSWKCVISKVDTQLSAKGTIYNIEMSPGSDQATTDKHAQIPKTINVKKEKTLVQTLDNFGNALTKANDLASEQTQETPGGSKDDPQRPRNIIKFNVQNGETPETTLSTWTIMTNDTTDAVTKNIETSKANNSVYNFTFTPDDDIHSALEKILGNTNEAACAVAPGSTSSLMKTKSNSFPSWFIYDNTVIVKDFDPVSNKPITETTITVVPKIVTKNAHPMTDRYGDQHIKKAMSDNILVKAYEYIYTGKNTSILDLDLTFNNFWAATVSLYSQSLVDRDFSVKPNTNNIPLEAISPVIKFMNKQQNKSKTAKATENKTQPKKFLEDYSPAALNMDLSDYYSAQVATTHVPYTNNLIKGTSPAGGVVNNNKLSIFGYMSQHSNISFRNAANSDMLVIEMSIRGDPYWFGTTSEEAAGKGRIYHKIRKESRDKAVFQSCDPLLYLKFKLPGVINEQSGLMEFNENSLFTGVYAVTGVISTFERGKFTQRLSCSYDRAFDHKSAIDVLNPIYSSSNAATATDSSKEMPSQQFYSEAKQQSFPSETKQSFPETGKQEFTQINTPISVPAEPKYNSMSEAINSGPTREELVKQYEIKK